LEDLTGERFRTPLLQLLWTRHHEIANEIDKTIFDCGNRDCNHRDRFAPFTSDGPPNLACPDRKLGILLSTRNSFE
jgi:hypothetical protein